MFVKNVGIRSRNLHVKLIWKLIICIFMCSFTRALEDIWRNLKCDEHLMPDNCNLNTSYATVEEYERCAPARLPINVRNYILGRAGRGITYRDNRDAFERLKIIPQIMLDTSDTSLEVTVLGRQIAHPIGIAPAAYMKLANPDGEIAVAKAAMAENAIMILSSSASTTMEEVAENVNIRAGNFWMQLYIFRDRSATVNIVRRAENLGFKAIVLTVDSNILAPLMCDARSTPRILYPVKPNAPGPQSDYNPDIMTSQDIIWLRSITSLPIVAKGILTGEDATKAIMAGASAIIVSNHGGRQLDGVPASIDVLPDVVKAVNRFRPRRDVYLDSGVRNGFDVYKALARGAKMVFVGRPTIWGLIEKGEDGVRNVLNILRTELNDTMILAGATNPSRIQARSVVCATCKNSL